MALNHQVQSLVLLIRSFSIPARPVPLLEVLLSRELRTPIGRMAGWPTLKTLSAASKVLSDNLRAVLQAVLCVFGGTDGTVAALPSFENCNSLVGSNLELSNSNFLCLLRTSNSSRTRIVTRSRKQVGVCMSNAPTSLKQNRQIIILDNAAKKKALA